MVVCVIISICFFQQKWPYFKRIDIIGAETVEENRGQLSLFVPNGYVVVDHHALPHILLKYLDNVYSIFTDF